MLTARLVLLSFLSGSVASAVAQLPVEQGPKPDTNIRLNVQVTSGGQPVSGLTQADLRVVDNKNAAGIVSVKEETPATEPAHAIILLDAVNVRYTEMSFERDQVTKFLRSNGGKLAIPTCIAVLTDTGVQVQKGFTLDGNLLASSVEKQVIGLRSVNRSAGFYGATERFSISATALRTLSSYAGSLPGRKFLLWISPGWPILSGAAVELTNKAEEQIFANIMQISSELRNANMTLYAIDPLGASEDLTHAVYYQDFVKGVSKPQDAQIGNLALQVLAEQSGGLALRGSTDIAGMMSRCMLDATSWYEVRLARADAVGDKPYHRIDLKVDRPGVAVRTRNGYYSGQ